MPSDAIFDRLNELGAQPSRQPDGAIRARGICHGGDSATTLKLTPTSDRRWIAKCFKQDCDPGHIFQTILATGEIDRRDGPVSRQIPEVAVQRGRPDFFDDATVREIIEQHNALMARPDLLARLQEDRRISPEVVASEFVGFNVRDGRITIPYQSPHPGDRQRPFQRDRWKPSWDRTPDEIKVLAQKGRDRWIFCPRPDLLADGWALLAEGAMDALACVSAGIPAIAAPSGTGWKSAWTDELTALNVQKIYIAPDADPAGQNLLSAGMAELPPARIAVVPVDLGLSDHGDLTDFLLKHGPDDLLKICRRAEREQITDGAIVLSFDEIDRQEVDYLLPGIPLSMASMLAGHPGLGKSLLKVRHAAMVTLGGPGRAPAGVLLLDGEDAPVITRLRLEAAGADVSRVHTLRLRKQGEEVGIVIPDHLPEIRETIVEREIALVYIDPINSFFPPGIDYFKDTHVRRVLGPLGRLAEELKIAIVVVAHLTKGQQAEALHRVGGSVGYGGTVRSAFILDRDPEDPEGEQGDRRVLVHVKSNVGRKIPAQIFQISEAEIGGSSTAKIDKIGESEIAPGELLAANAERPTKTTKAEVCADAIRDLLSKGRRPGDEIKSLLTSAGHKDRTIQRAAKEIVGVVYEDEGFPKVTYWRLPTDAERFTRQRPTVAPSTDGATANGAHGATQETPMNTGDSTPVSPQSRHTHMNGATGLFDGFRTTKKEK